MIEIINKSENTLEYATELSAGFDIKANEDGKLGPGQHCLVSTGLFLKLDGQSQIEDLMSGDDALYELQIRSKSGLAAKYNVVVANSPGTVDADYPGEIKVILANHGVAPFLWNKGDKIAQGVVCRVYRALGVSVKEEKREGGFGSTGK